MSPRKQLQDQLWRITEIYLNAKENFNYCYYLHRPDTKEEAEYIAIDRSLLFIRHSLWRLTIIELSKLYSSKENDKFNLHKLVNRFSEEGFCSKLGIDFSDVLIWESQIISKGVAIENVNTLRDKIYAHTDPNKDSYKTIDLFFHDIETLLEIAASIIKDINLKVFAITADLKTPTFDRKDFDMVRILAKCHRAEIDQILNLKK
jgi:hypothetical protein